MNRVVITPQAERDLRFIHDRLQDVASTAASRWSNGIRRQIKTLSRFPERVPLAPESETFEEPIRQLLYGKGSRGTYRVLFAIIDKAVYVLHVRHGSRDVLRAGGESA